MVGTRIIAVWILVAEKWQFNLEGQTSSRES